MEGFDWDQRGKASSRPENKMKRIGLFLALLLMAAGLCQAANQQAERAFREGRKQERAGKVVEAFEAFRRAAELEPNNTAYVLAREVARQNAAFRFANAGIRLFDRGLYAEAIHELEQAAKIDPSNDFVKQELSRAREAAAPPTTAQAPEAPPAGEPAGPASA